MYTPLTETDIASRLAQARRQPYNEEVFPQFAGRPARASAVMVPLAMVDDDWHVLYTRRTDLVDTHKGQVSFPGGSSDPGDDTPEATALREAEEEVGLRPADVRVLGRLGEMLTVTNFIVTPVVAVFPWPYAFRVHTIEVGRVFTLPLKWLADHNNWQEFMRRETQRSVIMYFPYDGELLWGVTARITIEFLRVIGLLDHEL